MFPINFKMLSFLCYCETTNSLSTSYKYISDITDT